VLLRSNKVQQQNMVERRVVDSHASSNPAVSDEKGGEKPN